MIRMLPEGTKSPCCQGELRRRLMKAEAGRSPHYECRQCGKIYFYVDWLRELCVCPTPWSHVEGYVNGKPKRPRAPEEQMAAAAGQGGRR
jgi:hypothetical protein